MKSRNLFVEKKGLLLIIFFLLFFSNLLYSQFFYGIQQNYGKNGVVYNNFDWNYYRLSQYDVFFYQRGSRNAQYVVTNLDDEIKNISKLLKVNFNERFQVICFNTLTDLKQSNLNSTSDDSFNIGGVTRINGSKIFIYGTGNHNDLKIQLRAGLTEMLLNYLVSGDKFSKSISSHKNISLPSWFSDGLILYASGDKHPEIEAKIKDGIETKKINNLNSFSQDNSDILGYSVWNYIARKYGEDLISDLVFMSYYNSDAKEGFETVLGLKYKDLKKDWIDFYIDTYHVNPSMKNKKLEGEVVKSKNEEKIFQFTLANNKKTAAFATNHLGLFKVYTLDIEKKKKKKVFSGGYRIPKNEDLSYPLIEWHPNGETLAIIYEEKGTVFLILHDLLTNKKYKRPFGVFDKINSFEFSSDGEKLAIGGLKDGYSDIYVYHVKSKVLENITNDSFDDLFPTFINDDSQIVFSSNRLNDTLQTSKRFSLGSENMDIFIYDFKTKNKILKQATNTEHLNEIMSQPIAKNEISYLIVDENNIQRKFFFKMDSVINHIDTAMHYRNIFENYQITSDENKSILGYETSEKQDAFGVINFYNNKYRITYSEEMYDKIHKNKTESKYHKPLETIKTHKKENASINIKLDKKTYPIDLKDYKFEEETYKKFGTAIKTAGAYKFISKPDSTNPDFKVIDKQSFDQVKRIYKNIYFASEFITQFDNSNDNLDYQVFTGGPVFMNAGFNGLFQVTLSDVLNNYSITGGFRSNFYPILGLSLSPNSEFKLSFDDKNGRWNKSYLIYRRSMFEQDIDFNFAINLLTTKIQAKYIYPFDPISSFSISGALRRDRQIILGLEDISLAFPDSIQHFATTRVEYIYDNTINFAINLYRGTRYKFFAEVYQGFQANQTMLNLGTDIRNYTRLHRNIIWANRFAAGTSLGTQRLAYYLGGVDNSFRYEFDYSLQPSPNINYGFQTLMTNMRGFYQNIRHGTSFAIFNSELRIPIFQYFFEKPISWNILRHFQIVPFFDIGTAWTGYSPWSKENFENNEIIEMPSIIIELDRQRDPFVFGYGIGLRTQIFGYFIRADWAQGYDSGIKLDKLFYLSLNLDF